MNRGQRWLNQRARFQAPNPIDRAVDTAKTVGDRPVWITVSRLVNGSTVQLPPQLIRIEVVQNVRTSNEVLQRLQELSVSEQYVVILAYKDHPTIPNTDLARSDLFYYQERIYEVVEFIDTVPGRYLASVKLTP